MENFSTPRAGLLPRAANLATLVVLVTATWWSGAQRPLDQAAIAGARAGQTAGSQPAAQPLRPAATELPALNGSSNWPADASTLARDGLQAVGYQPPPKR